MATIKRLTGNVSVGITGKQALDFTNYGVTGGGGGPVDPPTGPGGDEIFDDVIPYRMNILADPKGGSIVAVSGVSAGKAYVRPDGLLGLDLTGIPGLPFVTGSYLRAGGTSPGAVTFQANVIPESSNTVKLFGLPPGQYYLPETDSDDNVVVEPTETTRFVHISPTGFTQSQIATAHGVSSGTVNGVFLRDTAVHPSLGGNGTTDRYGTTPTFALDESRGRVLAQTLTNDVGEADVWVLFQRGGTYGSGGGTGAKLWGNSRGFSKLHPGKIGAYGTGARPIFVENAYSVGTSTAHVVVQGFHSTGGATFGNNDTRFLVFDDIHADGPIDTPFSFTGKSRHVCSNITFRRARIRDNFYVTPRGNAGAFWSNSAADRTDPMFLSGNFHPLVEKISIDTTGWNWGYRIDFDKDFPHNPNNFSHGGYMQGDNSDCTFRDAIISWPSFTIAQARSAGHFERVIAWGMNGSLNMAASGDQVRVRPYAGNYGYIKDFIATHSGQKDTLRTEREWVSGFEVKRAGEFCANRDGNGVKIYRATTAGITGSTKPTHTSGTVSDGGVSWAYVSDGFEGEINILSGGLNVQNVRTCADRVIVANHPLGNNFSGDPTQTGPVGRATASQNRAYNPTSNAEEAGLTGSHTYGDVKVWNFLGSNQNWNVSGLNSTALNSATIFNWYNQEFGGSGATMDDVRNFVRTDDAPWRMIPSMMRFFMDRFGWGSFWTPRTSATTVTFLPDASEGGLRPDNSAAFRGGTPGFRADCRDDWTTKDLPGTVSGDNVSLGGYPVRWNITPRNPLGTFRFAGGSLEMTAGILKPTALLDGGDITMSQGTKLYIDGHSGDIINVDLNESRFLNSGTAENINITARYRSEVVLGYDGSSFTIPSGRHVTLYGDVLAGFDGEVGGTASLTVQSGGALNFRHGVQLSMAWNRDRYRDAGGDALLMIDPVVGSIVTGGTSGATGRVASYIFTGNNLGTLILDEVTSTFQNGEVINGKITVGRWDWPDGAIGTVNAIPTITSPVIRNFATGIDGRRTHNVVSSITFNAGATITATGFPTGTYNLITGVPITNNATLPSGLTVVNGNTLRLVV